MKYMTFHFYQNSKFLNEQTESTLTSLSDLFYVWLRLNDFFSDIFFSFFGKKIEFLKILERRFLKYNFEFLFLFYF